MIEWEGYVDDLNDEEDCLRSLWLELCEDAHWGSRIGEVVEKKKRVKKNEEDYPKKNMNIDSNL